MDTNTLRRLRDDAMRDFDDGKLPAAEAQLTALIAEGEHASDSWTAGELAMCLQDRATVRRFSNRWQEALDDLAQCERIAMRLPLLPRRMTLPNVYYVRTLLLSTPYSDVYDPADAAKAVAEFRKYPGPAWVADSMDAEIAFNQQSWDKAAALYLSLAGSLEPEGWMQGIAAARLRAGESFVESGDWKAAEREIQATMTFLEKWGPPDMLASARLNLARIRAASGESDQAWDLALEALSGIEALGRHFRDVGEQQRFLANKLRFYDRAFDIAQTTSGAEGNWRAWSIAERAKSFYLCQLVANAEIGLFEGVDPKDIRRLEALESRLDELERTFSRLSLQDKRSPRGQDLEQTIRSVSQQKRDLLAVMMKQNPRWAALKTPPPFDIKAELQKLKPAWIVVSYFWVTGTNDGSVKSHVFWMNRNRLPQLRSIPWTSQDLKTLDDLRSLLRGTVSPGETTFPTELAAKVLPPEVLESVGRDSQMLISPHDRLKEIALQTMPVNNDKP